MTDLTKPPADRHTVAAYFNVKDCPELLAQSLPHALWADEVIVADVSVGDRIEQLCRTSFPQVKYIRTDVDDIFDRLRRILPRIESDYVLMIDSDEFYTPALAAEIQSELARPCEFDGFHVPQIFYNFGTRWGPGAAWMRLFHKERHTLPLTGSAHLMPTVPGKSKVLQNAYQHHNNPKLGMVAVKHFRYEAMSAMRRTDEELEERQLGRLTGVALFRHAFWNLLRINVRFVRHFRATRKYGYSGLCHAYSEIFRAIAEDVANTEELGMRTGKVERGNRGYF